MHLIICLGWCIFFICLMIPTDTQNFRSVVRSDLRVRWIWRTEQTGLGGEVWPRQEPVDARAAHVEETQRRRGHDPGRWERERERVTLTIIPSRLIVCMVKQNRKVTSPIKTNFRGYTSNWELSKKLFLKERLANELFISIYLYISI